jgi:hypothetical protein
MAEASYIIMRKTHKLSLYLIKQNTMKAYGGTEVELLTS